VICVDGERVYFCKWGWTTQIKLKLLRKLLVVRKSER
jgi:hypothetical protein